MFLQVSFCPNPPSQADTPPVRYPLGMKGAEFPKLALNMVAYVYNQYVACV